MSLSSETHLCGVSHSMGKGFFYVFYGMTGISLMHAVLMGLFLYGVNAVHDICDTYFLEGDGGLVGALHAASLMSVLHAEINIRGRQNQ